MAEEVLQPLQRPIYPERPAFTILMGCVAGLLAFDSPRVLLRCLILLAAGLLLLGLSLIPAGRIRKHSGSFRILGFVSLFGAVFGFYAAERTRPALLFPDEVTLPARRVLLLYPVASHSGSRPQYAAEAEIGGEWVSLLLRPADGKRVKEEYGSQAACDLRLSSIATGTSYHRYLLSEGYIATGTFLALEDPRPSARPPLISRLQAFREKLALAFTSRTSELLSPKEQGLILALSLGDRSRLDPEVREDFTNAGLAHVMAVSGYHLGIVFLLLGLLLNRLLWRHSLRIPRHLLLFLGILLYTLLSGGATATVRALVMSTLALLASALGRRTDAVQLLSLTMLFFLFLNPFAYLSVGLLLSIAAVWGILTFLPLFERLIRPEGFLLRQLRDAFFVTVSAQLALFPLLFLFFQKVELSVFWSNIPLVFLSMLLIPYGLVVLLITLPAGGLLPDLFYLPLRPLSEMMLAITGYFGSEMQALAVTWEWDLIQAALCYAALGLGYHYLAGCYNHRLIRQA